MTSFDGKRQNLQTSFFAFFIFAKVRPIGTLLTDTHTRMHARTYARTHAHTHTHTQKRTSPWI